MSSVLYINLLEIHLNADPITLQTTDFKNSLAHARSMIQELPGGELLIEEQNELIAMLEQLRDAKR